MCSLVGCVGGGGLVSKGVPVSTMMSLQCTVPEKLKFASREINAEIRSHRVRQQHLWPHTREEQRIRQLDLFQHIMRVRFNFKIWKKEGSATKKRNEKINGIHRWSGPRMCYDRTRWERII